MMFLEKEEIDRLTGKKQRRTQMQVLDAMGITYFVNGIDELVVSRRHVEARLGTAASDPAGKAPNFAILEKAS